MDPCSVVGGASFPGRHGGVGVTWPMMVAVASDDGVEVSGRWAWVRRMLVSQADQGWGRRFDPIQGGRWRAGWDELTRVEYVRASAIRLVTADDDVCEFGTPAGADLASLKAQIGAHGIPVLRRATSPLRHRQSRGV